MTAPDRALATDHLVLTIPLVDHITAEQLARLLRALEWHYRANLWVEHVEDGDPSTGGLQGFKPRRFEELWVVQLEIGSPNLLKVRGVRKQVLQVATVISTILGVPLVAAESFEAYAQGRKAIAEAQLIRMQITERVTLLEQQGLIPPADSEGLHNQAVEMMSDLEKSSEIISPAAAPTLERSREAGVPTQAR